MSRKVTRYVPLCPVNAENHLPIVGRNGIRKTKRATAMTIQSHHSTPRNFYSCFTDYENQTILHHADKLLRGNAIPEHCRDDIMQELAVCLWKRLATFDPEKSDRKTFASRVVQQKAVDILRRHYSAKEKFQREMVSLNTSVSFDGEEMEIIQLIPDQGKQISPDIKHDIDSTIESLDCELREMCLALKEMSLREYCSLCHVSRFTANRRLAKLRNIFGKTF